MTHVEWLVKQEVDKKMGPITVLYCFHTAIPPNAHMKFGFAFSNAPAFYRRTDFSRWRPWDRNYA